MVEIVSLDHFLMRAWLAGIIVALIAGPVGCFVIWRRMSYFGDTMAHGALLGVAFSLLMEMDIFAGVFLITIMMALLLASFGKIQFLHSDSLLGMFSHTALSLGVVLLALMPTVRVDLMGFLFGDILAVTKTDLLIIFIVFVFVSGVILLIWQRLLGATVSRDIAQAEGLRPEAMQLVFLILLAGLIAVAMQLVGILLITSLLIIPAASARLIAWSPEIMAAFASLIGVFAVSGGLGASYLIDTPTGPSIVLAAFASFLTILFMRSLLDTLSSKKVKPND